MKNKLLYLIEFFCKFIVKLNPRLLMRLVYFKYFHKNLNLRFPQTLIEKIYWLQLYSDTSLWTLGADKYRVREYVDQKGCNKILNKLYGKWDHVDDIDWERLPNSFVLKSNNGCGQVILVKDKAQLNINEIKKQLYEWLVMPYGWHSVQLHYTRIKPCIIAEELLINDQNPNESLIDYKVWCFDGRPECILVCFNRSGAAHLLSMYTPDWRNISDTALRHDTESYSGKDIPEPKSLSVMLESAQKLSKDIPQVRVDFYEVNGKTYFGEMTFTSGFGNYSYEYYQYLGSKVDLSKVHKLDKINRK